MTTMGMGGLQGLGSSDPLFGISGLYGYWSADNVTVSGGAVVTIPDQSANRIAARTLVAAGSGPTYSASNASFNGRPAFTATTGAAARVEATLDIPLVQQYTVYMVIQVQTNVNYMYWRSNAGNFTDSAGFYVQPTNEMQLQVLDSSGNTVTTASIATGTPTTYVNCCVYNGASSAIYNNNSSTAAATGTLDSNSCNVLSVGTFTAEECNYAWSCMVAYSGAHTAAQRKIVFQYLGSKYGIVTT